MLLRHETESGERSVISILDKRLAIVTGKGGTGKSTVCAGLALAAAKEGKRVLLIECDSRSGSKARITEIFGTPPVQENPREVYPNIFAANLSGEAPLKYYVVNKVRFESIYNLAFALPFVRNTMDFFPAIKEFFIMYRIAKFVADRRSGKYAWDIVIFDGPTTGHSLFYLQSPKMILDMLKVGAFANDARFTYETIVGRDTTTFNVVTLAEEMPVNETVQLIRNAKVSLDVPLGMVFINMVNRSPLADGLGEKLKQASGDPGFLNAAASFMGSEQAAGFALEAAAFQRERSRLNQHYIDRLLKEEMRFLQLPYVYSRNFDVNTIIGISDVIRKGLAV